MIVERTTQGAWLIYGEFAGVSITRRYFFMSKREALREFRAECREIAAKK